MAIDDVRVTPDAQCIIPITTTTAPPPTTPGIHTPLSCDFENDLCQWTLDLSLSDRWLRRQGQTNTLFGPHYGKINI